MKGIIGSTFLNDRIEITADGRIYAEGYEINLIRRHGGTDGYKELPISEIMKNMFEDEYICVMGINENLKEITLEIEVEKYLIDRVNKLSYYEVKNLLDILTCLKSKEEI